MAHISHSEELTPERMEHYERLGAYVRLQAFLEYNGLESFDKNGMFDGHDGIEVIDSVLTHLEKLELFEYCVVLRDLRLAFKERFGR